MKQADLNRSHYIWFHWLKLIKKISGLVPEQESKIQKTRKTVGQVPVPRDEPGLRSHDEKYLPYHVTTLRGIPHPSNEHHVSIPPDEH